jgi:two-component system, NtrC family, nitrogen regulation sensor histidine kinase GlnL
VNQPDPDQLAAGLIRTDRHDQVLWLNRAAADLFGGSRSSLQSTRMNELSPSLSQWCQRVCQQGRALRVAEARLERTGRIVDIVVHPIEQDLLIEIQPVAERIRQREMAERADRQQALTLLSRSLAHEIRNPLAGVRGAAQLIENATRDHTLERHAQMIQREVDRITGLIERFAGEDKKKRVAVNLHQVLDEAGELVLAEDQDGLSLDKRYDPSIPELESDPGQLHQLFLNLLRNSIQAGARTLVLTTRIEHDCPLMDDSCRHAVRIDVDDDGSGVPAALRDRLFLPLVSGRQQGSGFGLAVVQQIARRQGGLVEFIPLSSGSRFRVRLPLITAGATAHD